jgi:3-oxoacyl-[acyl-carrier-protein] synthase-3
MDDAVRKLLASKDIALEDIDLVIPHQANIRILKKLIDRLQVPQSKVFMNVSKYGNTSAASIPIALDEAYQEGRMKQGDLVLFCSFGGGFTWGATLINW